MNKQGKTINRKEPIESKVSTAIMNLLWQGKLRVAPSASESTRDGGVAQRTYLLNREDQRKEFLNAGYIKGKEGDYGLVKKAVNNRNIPIYQIEPDAANREDLVPIGNINTMYFPDKGELVHAGRYPTTLYYNYQNGKFYQKAWDLNDYGGSSGHTPLQKLGANILDKIGSPTVVTSGFQEISNDTLNKYHDILSPFIKKFFKSKGLIYDYLQPTDVNPTMYLPEVTITGKNRNKLSNSNYNSDQIYIEGIGLVNKAKRTFQKGGRIDRENYIPNLFNEGGYIKENNNSIQNTVQKHQQGGTVQDNTRVWKPQIVLPFKLSEEQKARIRQQLAEKNQARVYDKDKADYYRNLQRAYNSNFFGFGVFGNQTNYDSTTTQGQKAIEASANYTKDNIANLGATLLTTGVGTTQRGVLPLISKRRTIGQLRDLSKYKIGEGAEAIVINNSPTTVGKITTITRGEMNLRNSIPNTVKSKFVGYTKDDTMRLPTYIQRKVKTITEETFPKYIKKLDKAMGKKRYQVVDDPDVQYRAYTNGDLIVDDVSPDNIGLNWLRKPKMIDFTVSPASEWIH